MIRGAAFALLATLSLGVAAGPAQSQRPQMPSVGVGTANPSAIVAAELGMARQARDEGQWTALRKLADKDAVVFAPGPVNAQTWLKQQTDPAQPVRWSPQQIFIACDGSYAAATGALERANGQAARFVTLWRQQRKGDYKWVMTATSDTPWSDEADGMIKASVADCSRRGERPERRNRDIVRLPDPPPASGSAQSEDGSLRWTWTETGDARTLEVFLRRGASEERVIQERIAEGAR